MDENYNIPVERDDLLFTVEMALFKAERLWPKKYVPGDHDRLKPMATAVVEHLELCAMRCFRRPPAPRHSTRPPSARHGGAAAMKVRTARRTDDGAGALQSRPFCLKLNAVARRDDDVVVEGDVDRLESVAHAVGHLDVRSRRSRIGRRVIVQKQESGGLELQRADADLAGIDRGVVDGASLVHLVTDETVLGVEEEDMQLLDLAMRRQRPAVVDDPLVGIELRMEPLRQRCPGHRDTQRLGGLDGADASLAEAVYGAQCVGPGREDTGGRAEGLQQQSGESPGLGGGVRSRQQEL